MRAPTSRGCAVLALLVLAGAPAAQPAANKTIRVGNDKQLRAAVHRLASSGGTIRLRPHFYRQLVVPPRSTRPLWLVGSPGVRVERVVLNRTRNVSLSGVTITPRTQHAIVELHDSKHIELHGLVVTAQGTPYSASVAIHRSRHVSIRRSRFTHCGDRSTQFTFCLMLFRRSSHVLVEDNRFHDCRGCDFIHGRFGSNLTIRRNRFERALPCSFRLLGRVRCRHQDLIELFAGRRLRVEGNYFGVYKYGGAQLYITGPVDHALIANNLFVGTDRHLPGYRARMALIIGAKGSERLPRYVEVVNNTILTGFKRIDGYEGSLRISRAYRYGGYSRRERPLIVNNVIALLRDLRPRLLRRARIDLERHRPWPQVLPFGRGRRCLPRQARAAERALVAPDRHGESPARAVARHGRAAPCPRA